MTVLLTVLFKIKVSATSIHAGFWAVCDSCRGQVIASWRCDGMTSQTNKSGLKKALHYLYNKWGSHKPIAGNVYSKKMASTWMAMNGIMPAKIWFNVTCGGLTPLR